MWEREGGGGKVSYFVDAFIVSLSVWLFSHHSPPHGKNQRTDSPESRLVYTRLEVAVQILERKIYKNTKISSLYS